jgi:copper chaperone CopZ
MKAQKRNGPPTAVVPARATHRFPVDGLDCSACGADLRAGLRQVPGIQAIAVNLPAREIAVTYDPGRVDTETIRLRLEALGLGCSD